MSATVTTSIDINAGPRAVWENPPTGQYHGNGDHHGGA